MAVGSTTGLVSVLIPLDRAFLLAFSQRSLRHLSERESLSIDRDKGDREKARTFTDIVQDFRCSKGTHVDLRSQHDPPDGSEPRHLSANVQVHIAKVDPAPQSRLCHEPLRVALGSDPSPDPELSQDPTMHLCVCSELP